MIGIGIVTFNRQKGFIETLESIKNNLPKEDYFLLSIKDGGSPAYNDNEYLKQLDSNLGVGRVKNLLINELLDKNCTDIFILEDDCRVIDSNVWKYCIDFSRHTGLLHFNWDDYRTEPTYQNVHNLKFPEFEANLSINVEANFSYFEKRFLDSIRFDENYINAWEHIDLELQGSFKGFLPGFRAFVSPSRLKDMLRVEDYGKSSICERNDHKENIQKGYEYWLQKWGIPINKMTPPTQQDFVKKMTEITQKYANRHRN